MKKTINTVRGIAFLLMFISIGAIESESKVPLVIMVVSILVLLVITFIHKEDDDYESNTR